MLNNSSLSLSLSSLWVLSAISSNLYIILTLRKCNHLAADIMVCTFKNITHSWSSPHIVKFMYRGMQAHTHMWICVVYSNNIWNCHQHIMAKGASWKAESQKHKVINKDGGFFYFIRKQVLKQLFFVLWMQKSQYTQHLSIFQLMLWEARTLNVLDFLPFSKWY